jgi:hypothetical protein
MPLGYQNEFSYLFIPVALLLTALHFYASLEMPELRCPSKTSQCPLLRPMRVST